MKKETVFELTQDFVSNLFPFATSFIPSSIYPVLACQNYLADIQLQNHVIVLGKSECEIIDAPHFNDILKCVSNTIDSRHIQNKTFLTIESVFMSSNNLKVKTREVLIIQEEKC